MAEDSLAGGMCRGPAVLVGEAVAWMQVRRCDVMGVNALQEGRDASRSPGCLSGDADERSRCWEADVDEQGKACCRWLLRHGLITGKESRPRTAMLIEAWSSEDIIHLVMEC
jgi:hypothetical protein